VFPPKPGLSVRSTAFCRELSERQGVQIDSHCEAVPTTLPKEISLCLYRVLQEALKNAVKHSGSRQFQVSLTWSDGLKTEALAIAEIRVAA